MGASLKGKSSDGEWETIEVEIDDALLDRIDERAREAVGGGVVVDAVAVCLMVDAYRTRRRHTHDLDDLNEGRAIVMPKSRAHAECMLAVASKWLEDNPV